MIQLLVFSLILNFVFLPPPCFASSVLTMEEVKPHGQRLVLAKASDGNPNATMAVNKNETMGVDTNLHNAQNFTWRVSQYPENQTWLMVDIAIFKAAKMWSNVAQVNFMHISNASSVKTVDIDIKFHRNNYDSSCNSNFSSDEIAHTKTLQNLTEFHFNGPFNWKPHTYTEESTKNINLAAIAANLFGHALLVHGSLGNRSHALSEMVLRSGNDKQLATLETNTTRLIQTSYGTRTALLAMASSCPIPLPSHMPNTQRNRCGTLYKQLYCEGDQLPIEAGNTTNRLNQDWIYEISSGVVNDGCVVMVCRLPNLAGSCHQLSGRAEGVHFHRLPQRYDNDIASLACSCGQTNPNDAVVSTPASKYSCPDTAERYMPDGRRRLCALAFKENNCNGEKLAIESGNVTDKLNDEWYEDISSAYVAPGCILEVCQVEGNVCDNFHGGIIGESFGTLGLGTDDYITSLSCTCTGVNLGSIAKTTAPTTAMTSTSENEFIDSTAHCSTTIRRYMPNGIRLLCAAVYKEEQCKGAAMAIENNNETRRLNSDWVDEISSAQVNSGCRLKICNFMGNCRNLSAESGGTDFAQLPSGFDNAIVSLSCLCDGDADHDGMTVLPTLRPDFNGRITTSRAGHGSCPQGVTEYMPDSIQPMCAAVYKGERCQGARLPLKVGEIISWLNSTWYAEISSAEVNSLCTLRLCMVSQLHEPCTNLTTSIRSENFDTLPRGFDDNIASLSCTCRSSSDSDVTTVDTPVTHGPASLGCPSTFTKYMPGGITRVCAAIYKEEKCDVDGGQGFIADGQRNGALSPNGRNKISSVQINPGCTLRACAETYYGNCQDWSGGSAGLNYDTLPSKYKNNIKSLSCTCSENSGDLSTTATSECSDSIRDTMPSDFRPLCAIAYKSELCNGDKLFIESSNVTNRLNDDWRDIISSAQVNSGCNFKVCIYTLNGACVDLVGESSGRNFATVPTGYRNNIYSFECTCGSRNMVITTTPRSITSTECSLESLSDAADAIKQTICAIAYKDPSCNGYRGRRIISPINHRVLDDDWEDSISSVQVNRGCMLSACKNIITPFGCKNFSGEATGKNFETLPADYDEEISWYSCSCNGEPLLAGITIATTSVASAIITTGSPFDDITTQKAPKLFIGQNPPPFLPNMNEPTCAVFSTGFLQQGATLAWIKKEVVNNTLANLAQASFVYGVAAPACSIFYCTKGNFGGLCESLGPGQHTNISNAQPFSIGSYICDCQYRRH